MKKGVALIELLIVIAIICILVAIIVTAILGKGERTIIEERCNPRWAQCTLNCSNLGGLATLEELDICVKKCDIQKESCLLLEK